MTANSMESVSENMVEATSLSALVRDDQPKLPSWDTCRRLTIAGIIIISLLPCYIISILLLPCYLIIATLTVVSETLTELFHLADRNSSELACPTCARPVAAAVKRVKPITISDIPRDILVLIFRVIQQDEWSDTSAVCLGLTCAPFYRVFKTIYPSPIVLRTGSGVGLKETVNDGWADPWVEVQLSDLLTSFMGPRYRLAYLGWDRVFLSIAVYGEFRGLAQMRLENRHDDYSLISYFSPWGADYHILFPNPWNFPEQEWYNKAEEIVRGLELELELSGGAKFGNALDRFVETHFYKQLEEDRIWDGFREWAEMAKM